MIEHLDIRTSGRGLVDITTDVGRCTVTAGVDEGLCTVFVQHTSASLVIQENAAPSAQRDLERWIERLVPDGDPLFEHVAEGPDDMPSHVKGAITATSLSIPIVESRLALGTWQGIFLWEHRLTGSRRKLLVHIGR